MAWLLELLMLCVAAGAAGVHAPLHPKVAKRGVWFSSEQAPRQGMTAWAFVGARCPLLQGLFQQFDAFT